MVSPQLRRQLRNTLHYSDQFDYPLTLKELWFWQIGTTHPLSLLKASLPTRTHHYLPGRSELPKLRHQRELFSQSKWHIARQVSQKLSFLPTIQAIFVTGALAMNNTPTHDDIDFMIVTTPHTLWLTRFLVVGFLTLNNLRRPPYLSEHSSPRVSDKICDNLYLDARHLHVSPHPQDDHRNLYLAHEILQAKPLLDKSNITQKFLQSNPWVAQYLPVAYKQSLKSIFPAATNSSRYSYLLSPLNLLLFLLQYLYMRPHISSEKISPGSAFFHPTSPSSPKYG